jgi:hypothetical protein
MRFLTVPAVCASLLTGMPALAEPPRSAEVEAFMRDYTETWNRHDTGEIARSFYRMGPATAEQQASLERQFENLRAQGYSRSDIREIRACLTGTDTAWAGMKYSRLTAAGAALPPADRASAYALRRFADGWRITRLMNADASAPLSCPDAS